MLTGRPPFLGTPAEMRRQHQQAPLPIEEVNDAPQPLVALLEVLLQKDPLRRFQTSTELLKVMPTIKARSMKGDRHAENLRKKPSSGSLGVTGKTPAGSGRIEFRWPVCP